MANPAGDEDPPRFIGGLRYRGAGVRGYAGTNLLDIDSGGGGTTPATGDTDGFLARFIFTPADDGLVIADVSTLDSLLGPFNWADVIVTGAGGGGASGRTQGGPQTGQGCPGGAGARRKERLSRRQIIDALPITLTIPSGGTGGAGVSLGVAAQNVGNPGGTPSGPTLFGSLLAAYPGQGGGVAASVTVGVVGGTGGGWLSSGAASSGTSAIAGGQPSTGAGLPNPGVGGAGVPGSGNSADGLPACDGGASGASGGSGGSNPAHGGKGGDSVRGGGGGGAGGGYNGSGTTPGNGGDGGRSGRAPAAAGGNAAFSSSGNITAGTGADGSDGDDTHAGGGGAGGGFGLASNGVGTGGPGGRGGDPGGGGGSGGGGRSVAGSAVHSGAGKRGGHGEIRIITYA